MGVTDFVLAFILVAALLCPLYGIYRRHRKGRAVKTMLITQIASFFALGALCVAIASVATGGAMAAESATEATASGITDMAWGMIAAALSTGISGIGGGIAVAAAASAALGAISENEKSFGKAVLFVGLAEGIALYGMIISFMILGKF